jgi:hypothetical protein
MADDYARQHGIDTSHASERPADRRDARRDDAPPPDDLPPPTRRIVRLVDSPPDDPPDRDRDRPRASRSDGDGMESHHHHDQSPDDWPAFVPVSSSPPVARIEPIMLPASLAAWISDIAERQHVPLEFAAVPALVSASALIGRRVGVAPKSRDDWTEIATLYGMVVAHSGAGKSPAEGEALAPYQTIADVAEHSHRGEGPPPPYLAGDATVEALGVRLGEITDDRALLVVRSEIAGLLETFKRKGREGDRAFYLEAWEGNVWHRVDRITRNRIGVRLCLSLYGGIQPGALVQHVAAARNGGSGADGLLQRFGLAVYPDRLRTYEPIDRTPDAAARERADRAFGRLARLDTERLGAQPAGPGKVPALRFASEAQPIFTEWHDAHTRGVRRNDAQHSDAFLSHLSKYRGLVPSLALLFHLLDHEGERSGGIDRLSTERAIAMVRCLEQHAEKIYGEKGHRASPGAVTLAEMIDANQISDGTNIRDLYRRQRSGLRNHREVVAAARELEGRGWLRLEHGERRSLVIRLRPDWLECLERDGV